MRSFATAIRAVFIGSLALGACAVLGRVEHDAPTTETADGQHDAVGLERLAAREVDERAVEAPSPSLKDTLLAAPLEGVFLEREQGERPETELP